MYIRIVFILLFIISFGCGESSDKKEDLANMSYTEIASNDQIQLVNGNDLPIQVALNELAEKDTFAVPGQVDYIFYKIYVNASGAVDKVEQLESYGEIEKHLERNINLISKWKFKPYLEKGKPLSFVFDFVYSPYVMDQAILDLLFSPDEEYAVTKTHAVEVGEAPQIVGGIEALKSAIKYPSMAKRAGVEGRVFVATYINEKGEVNEVKILRGIGSGCDMASIVAVSKMKFTPGKRNGEPVAVQISIPIMYRLN